MRLTFEIRIRELTNSFLGDWPIAVVSKRFECSDFLSVHIVIRNQTLFAQKCRLMNVNGTVSNDETRFLESADQTDFRFAARHNTQHRIVDAFERIVWCQ